MRTDAGEVIAADWADGFFGAIRLNAVDWRSLVSGPDRLLLSPIFVFCRDDDGNAIVAPHLSTVGEAKKKLIGEGWRHIPETVEAIRTFWLTRAAEAAGATPAVHRYGRARPR